MTYFPILNLKTFFKLVHNLFIFSELFLEQTWGTVDSIASTELPDENNCRPTIFLEQILSLFKILGQNWTNLCVTTQTKNRYFVHLYHFQWQVWLHNNWRKMSSMEHIRLWLFPASFNYKWIKYFLK